MAVVRYGSKLDTLIRQVEGDEFSIDQFGYRTQQVVYKCGWPYRFQLMPTNGSQLADLPGLFLGNVVIRREPANVAVLTCKYYAPPAVRYDLLTSSLERPIEQHPRFSEIPDSAKIFDPNTKQFMGFDTTNAEWRGIESYIVGGAVWQRTSWSFFAPKESDIGQVGKLTAPLGLVGSTAGKWMFIGAPTGLEGPWWTRREQWQFSPTGWNAFIYAGGAAESGKIT